MKEKIASLIKRTRLEKGFSQKELSEGICAQAVISKIEKAEVSPSVELFFKLVKKLDIDSSVILELFQLKKSAEESILTDELKSILYRREYDTLEYFLQFISKDVSPIQSPYIQYLNGVLLFGKYKKSNEALEILEGLLPTLVENANLFLRVGIAIAGIYSELEEYVASMNRYESLIHHYHESNDWELKVLFQYGYSRILYLCNNFEKALVYNAESLELLKSRNTLFMLGNTLLMRANILAKRSIISEAIDMVKKSIVVYDLEGDELLKNLAQSFFIDLLEQESKDEKEIN
ncbi:TPA: helix-turn-helix transcriptional regulator [Streptococcus suis]|uniref:helix-turn-helix transcriptional regulator n=1 Tax=Streptococcus suis TaxID=1307 RepID=UPI001374FF01|nr:helix-turn-helix transcriptional regulator [Streptococcus suis]HEM2652269.1 helix-turn-helix transcriptional regulator [Streptococcus suis]HEM5175629.1 helix-turn-helix transcriptional regulator [Streptococcus suis]HEM5192481.1 helix-turn-helix transcriptional regulator [Streptococcus suis]HEM5198302.1 helix-turn-helix transcriptional regulator [Streptococcus suis]HEM5250166.1 helix-turn-helix transcriptional regulator [Streptococcus suis]